MRALRAGAKPLRVECGWGGPVDLEKARKVFRESSASVLFAVHAETSTGVLQQIAPLREIVDDRGVVLMIDAVTSIQNNNRLRVQTAIYIIASSMQYQVQR